MAWTGWLRRLVGAAPREGTGRAVVGPVEAGPGSLTEWLGGLRLRQQVLSPGMGTESQRVLGFQPDGQFVCHEVRQREGGREGAFERTEPRYGTWSASGDLPAGEVTLTFVGGETTRHSLEYHGGDTCLLDGVTTLVN